MNPALEKTDSLKEETRAAPQAQITPQPPQEQAPNPVPKPADTPATAHADARDYLPPQALDEPKAAAADNPPEDSQGIGKRYMPLPRRSAALRNGPKQDQPTVPKLERRRMARLSKPQPTVQSYIWFGGPAPNLGAVRISGTLKTAHCLACLTNHHADCSTSCR